MVNRPSVFSVTDPGGRMKIPCAERLVFIVSGLAFLQPALSNSQFYNITLVATALVLGSRFHLTEISLMILKEKSISTLSYFFSDAKFCTHEMQMLHLLHMRDTYKIQGGYFLIDDTMKHHTKFCKWIHGVFVLFDHALNTHLKCTCIVFLYHSDGNTIKFPIAFRIYYKETPETGKKMAWERGHPQAHRKKYDLALDMLEWATTHGFPPCTVLADSWYGIGPFVAGLKRLELSYVLEIKETLKIKRPCQAPKLTPSGRRAKHQFDWVALPEYFQTLLASVQCGFPANLETGKGEKVLYDVKVATGQLKSIAGKHRLAQSIDPTSQTSKYLLTDQLTWEAIKILSAYSQRWAIEEFFRNAKQLTDLEGATLRSEQGVTRALCLVSWIDSLLHLENYKQCIAGKLPQESVTIPSIVRKAQSENLKAFIERVRHDEGFVQTWLEIVQGQVHRKRKPHKELVVLKEVHETPQEQAA